MSTIGDLLAAVDGAKRRLRGQVKDAAANPGAYLEQTADQAALTLKGMVQNPLENFGPGKVGGGLAGILRRGGNDTLAAVHQMGQDQLFPWLKNGKLPRELLSPSIALNRAEIPQNFGPLTFVARPDALDPGSGRVAGKIWNRDAYTPRKRDFRGLPAEEVQQLLRDSGDRPDTLRREAAFRNATRFQDGGFRDMRMMEGGGDLDLAFAHQQAIMSSPTMRSFKEYENNPRGAALLAPRSDPALAAQEVDRAFFQQLANLATKGNPLANSFLGDHSGLRRIANELPELWREPGAPAISNLLRDWKKDLAYLPSKYGELKITGPVRLDRSNFAGAMADPEVIDAGKMRTLKEILQARGIPVVQLPRGDLNMAMAREMSKRALTWRD